MKEFEKVFKSILLSESDDSLEQALSADLDETPSKDKEVSELDGQMEGELSSAQAEDEANEMLKGKIEKNIKKGNDQIASWATALEEFAAFINDATNEESIKHIIDNAGTGSALASVKKQAGKQMTRVATDCVVLAQILKSLIGSVSVTDVLGANEQ